MDLDRTRLLLASLAAGDTLGATSEFVPQAGIPALYEASKQAGWPHRSIGGGAFGWQPGESTDDSLMAWLIVRTCLEEALFDPQAISASFVGWYQTNPKDLGGTIRRVLSRLSTGAPWHETAWREYQANPTNAPNGALMRNGVIAGLADDLNTAFNYTVLQGIITHYHPLSVLTCGAQTWLLWKMLVEKRWPFEKDDWIDEFRSDWARWLEATQNPFVSMWFHRVEEPLVAAWETLATAPFGPVDFDPFETDFAGRDGYCLLALQVAVWALCWSIMPTKKFPFPVPKGFPAEVFKQREASTLAWVPLIGHDADTMASVAGPLIAAAHGGLPPTMIEGLRVLEWFESRLTPIEFPRLSG